MANHSSILATYIGYSYATHCLENYTCLENSMERGTWQASVHRVPKESAQLSH